MNVDITGVMLPEFVKKVYEMSSPQGLGVLHYRPEGLTNDEVNEILDASAGDKRICLSMDYVSGRACKMTVFKDEDSIFIRFPWFDHTNEQFIELLRTVWPKGKPFPVFEHDEHNPSCNCMQCRNR
jgi:hypothetical protein